jgi:hypothetical protein
MTRIFVSESSGKTGRHVSERYIRIGFGLLDPDLYEHDRRREAHQSLVDDSRRRDPT